MSDSEDGVFLDLNIKDKIIADEIPVGVILQAMAEYQMIPMATPSIHRLLCAFQNKILTPSFLKAQEAMMQEHQTMAENMQKAAMAQMKHFGIVMPPSAEDLRPPEE